MKILLSGSSGLVGKALVNFLSMTQHQVFKLVRRKSELKKNEISWDPEKKKLNPTSIEGFDVIIHLAGENIAGRWTAEKKKKIEQSRIGSTQLLCDTLNKLHLPPEVLITASAIGYYGNQKDRVLTETSSKGAGFLADLCEKWEKPTQSLLDKDIRVVNVRTGIVLSPKGGALKTLLLPFKLGMGGTIGTGKQYMSWIALDDLISIYNYLLNNRSVQGIVNAVSPYPVTNYEFTKTLGAVLHRPTFLSIPTFLIQNFLGEMGETVLLSSQRVRPEILLNNKFQFTHAVLGEALEYQLTNE